jgi:hypothetical protein
VYADLRLVDGDPLTDFRPTWPHAAEARVDGD